jgi:hypothetical protein
VRRKAIQRALFAFGPLLLYAGSYFTLVRADPLPFMSGIGPWPRVPHYLVGGMVAEWIYSPIHAIDRRLRPRHWEYRINDAVRD